jgi:hypothetical protein
MKRFTNFTHSDGKPFRIPKSKRREFVERVFMILKYTLDDTFLTDESIRGMFLPSELKEGLTIVRKIVIDHLEEEIDETKSSFSAKDDSPESLFDTLAGTLENLQSEFQEDKNMLAALDEGLGKIKAAIKDLEEEYHEPEEDYEDFRSEGRISESSEGRSVFDDVDE